MAAAVSDPAETLLVADSFRVRANPRTGIAEARGFSHHLERFTSTVRAASLELGVLADAERQLPLFLDAALPRIAAFGAGFPRLEAHATAGSLSLSLSLRQLPQLTETLALRTVRHGAVPLIHPERKGPNLAALIALNRDLGAEALLLNAAGQAVEGSTTALLWWSASTLCIVDSPARVPSICEHLVLAAAAQFGVAVERRTVEPDSLTAHEVWAVNALHGIRLVQRIDDAELPAPNDARLEAFRRSLELTWQRFSE